MGPSRGQTHTNTSKPWWTFRIVYFFWSGEGRRSPGRQEGAMGSVCLLKIPGGGFSVAHDNGMVHAGKFSLMGSITLVSGYPSRYTYRIASLLFSRS